MIIVTLINAENKIAKIFFFTSGIEFLKVWLVIISNRACKVEACLYMKYDNF